MDFSWELLFELLGKVADTIGNVLGGTKKDGEKQKQEVMKHGRG